MNRTWVELSGKVHTQNTKAQGSIPHMEREKTEKAQHVSHYRASPSRLTVHIGSRVHMLVCCEYHIAVVAQTQQLQEESLVLPILQMSTQQTFDLERQQAIASSALLQSSIPCSATKTCFAFLESSTVSLCSALAHSLSPDATGSFTWEAGMGRGYSPVVG